MTRARKLILLLPITLLSGCASMEGMGNGEESKKAPVIQGKPDHKIEKGVASSYWKPQRTASSERFNPNAFTAAHKTLKLGSVIKVVRTDGPCAGKSVFVRINDRGPYVHRRVIDLSLASANALCIGKGLGNVELIASNDDEGKDLNSKVFDKYEENKIAMME